MAHALVLKRIPSSLQHACMHGDSPTLANSICIGVGSKVIEMHVREQTYTPSKAPRLALCFNIKEKHS